jgi:hypothetical protein
MMADELAELLRQSRAKNANLGITGLLLYKDADFMQVLEGTEDRVTELFETIQRDPRHDNVIRILEQSIEERVFGEWEMGFRDVKGEDLRRDPAFSSFLENGFTEQGGVNPSIAMKLLATFRET